MKGLSRSNLQYIRSFADAWPEFNTHVPQPVGHLPWGHIRTILDKKLDHEARNWYAAAAVEQGWSRNVLMNMIMNKTLEHSEGCTIKLCTPTRRSGLRAGPADRQEPLQL